MIRNNMVITESGSVDLFLARGPHVAFWEPLSSIFQFSGFPGSSWQLFWPPPGSHCLGLEAQSPCALLSHRESQFGGKKTSQPWGFADTPRKKLFFPLGAQVCLGKPENNTGKAAESSYREKQIPNTHFESWDLPRPERVSGQSFVSSCVALKLHTTFCSLGSNDF